MPRRTLSSLVVALLLAVVPASAFADGAGDDQYQDPLAAPSAPKKKKPTPSAAPVTSTPAANTAPAAAAAPASNSSQELPRTGAPSGLIGLGGALMIASGLALRSRTSAG